MDGKTPKLELLEPAAPESLLPDYGLWPWLVAAVVVVVIIAGIVILLRLRRPAAAPTPRAIRQAALAEATSALAAIDTDEAREAAVLCSLILRKFLATAAKDPALYQTHEEFVASHDALQALDPEARAATAEGFNALAALKYSPAALTTAPAAVIADARRLLETLNQGLAA